MAARLPNMVTPAYGEMRVARQDYAVRLPERRPMLVCVAEPIRLAARAVPANDVTPVAPVPAPRRTLLARLLGR